MKGLPLVPTGRGGPKRSVARSAAGVLDTALLVLVALVALAAVWWVVSVVLGTIIFFAKLAVLALVIAVLLRAYLWVRRRRA